MRVGGGGGDGSERMRSYGWAVGADGNSWVGRECCVRPIIFVVFRVLLFVLVVPRIVVVSSLAVLYML